MDCQLSPVKQCISKYAAVGRYIDLEIQWNSKTFGHVCTLLRGQKDVITLFKIIHKFTAAEQNDPEISHTWGHISASLLHLRYWTTEETTDHTLQIKHITFTTLVNFRCQVMQAWMHEMSIQRRHTNTERDKQWTVAYALVNDCNGIVRISWYCVSVTSFTSHHSASNPCRARLCCDSIEANKNPTAFQWYDRQTTAFTFTSFYFVKPIIEAQGTTQNLKSKAKQIRSTLEFPPKLRPHYLQSLEISN